MVGSIEGARSLTYQVLARKWRPQVFDAVVGQDPVTRTLRNALASGRVAHAYLFTGPRGVGKTTTARLLAKALACTARTGTEACGACPSCQDFTSGAPLVVCGPAPPQRRFVAIRAPLPHRPSQPSVLFRRPTSTRRRKSVGS